MIYGSVLVVVVGVAAALILLLHGKSGPGPGPSTVPSSGPTVGNFAFTVKQVKAVPTGVVAGTQQKANAAARSIEHTMDALYFTGFLDPNAWQQGDYGAVWKLFVRGAQKQAKKDEGTLTLGANAGSKFSSVTAGDSTAIVRVLLDPRGNPATAVVTVHFVATAKATDGTTAAIASSGDFFLTPAGKAWTITGYDVSRKAR